MKMTVIASALVAAITWNLITWWIGFPSSSSHTLVGGLVGAAVTHAGFGTVIYSGLIKNCIIYFYCSCSGYGYVIYHFNICSFSIQKAYTLQC